MTIDIVTMPVETNGHQIPTPGEVWIHRPITPVAQVPIGRA